MRPTVPLKPVLAALEQYDARLALGGLPAVTALVLAWAASSALILAVRFASFGETTLWWAAPWIALPLFWPALVLLPAAARMPTRLLLLCFTLAGLAAAWNVWLPFVRYGGIPPGLTATQLANRCAINLMPTVVYGGVLAWLVRGRDRSGAADMRGLRPYLAALVGLAILAVLLIVVPALALTLWMPDVHGEAGGLAVVIGIVMGGLWASFPWPAIVSGVAAIAITHGLSRPCAALAFTALALTLCPAGSVLSSTGLLAASINEATQTRYSPYPVSLWRPLLFSAGGLAVYGISLWLTRRKAAHAHGGTPRLRLA